VNTEPQISIMADFNGKLRQHLQDYIDQSGDSYYKVAKESDIPEHTMYSFKNGNAGLNAENMAKLVNHLNINLKDLIE
jgi:hypothetical protein